MSWELKWDADGERLYETGVDRAVVYPKVASDSNPYPKGYAWNGITSVQERPSGGEANPIWADNIKYLNLRSAEQFGITIEAYTYPDEFAECDGSKNVVENTGLYIGQQRRKAFGFTYRTLIGNDEQDTDYGYKIHLVYGCEASPSERSRNTVNDSPEAMSFSWEVDTTPVKLDGTEFRPIAHIEIDTTKFASQTLVKSFEDILYGTASSGGSAAVDAKLPLPMDVFTHFGYTPPEG